MNERDLIWNAVINWRVVAGHTMRIEGYWLYRFLWERGYSSFHPHF